MSSIKIQSYALPNGRTVLAPVGGERLFVFSHRNHAGCIYEGACFQEQIPGDFYYMKMANYIPHRTDGSVGRGQEQAFFPLRNVAALTALVFPSLEMAEQYRREQNAARGRAEKS
jgi:hypothetical protein